MPTVNCPSCGRVLEVDDTYCDWTVRCPHCATEFVPAEVAPELTDRNRRDDGGNSLRPRRRRHDPDREEWERREAVALVHGPGTWLEVCGWLGGLLLAGGGLVRIAYGAAIGNNAPPGEAEGAIAGGVVSALLALPYTIVMVVGGRKMRALSSFGWAMTASVAGIASFFLLCCVCVCAFFPVGFGIWGLVVLNNPLVRRAFEQNQAPTFDRDRAPVEREWDDGANF